MSRKYLNGRWCVRCNKTDPTPYLRENIKHFPPTGRVLDIGCGNGRNSRFMESLGYDVVSVDMAGDFGVQMTLGKDRIPGRGKYDIILANYVLMFLKAPEKEQVIREIWRVAKKQCVIMIEMYPAKDGYKYDLKKLVDRHFLERNWQKVRLSKDRCILKR